MNRLRMGLDGRGVTRAMSLSPGQWGALEMDLYEEGMAYYQWCCLPTFDHDLPEKGERIIFFCQENDGSYRLYLMMVVAADEECHPFVKGKHEIIMKDDCCSWGPEQRLAKAATLRIKEILGVDD